jgi:glucans biosynthesis protein
MAGIGPHWEESVRTRFAVQISPALRYEIDSLLFEKKGTVLTISRRSFIAASLPWGVAALAAQRGAVPTHLIYGPPHPFSFERLQRHARSLAHSKYSPPALPAPEIVRTINYDTAQKIRFRRECALWTGDSEPYPVRFFSLRDVVASPVRVNVVNGATARPLLYSPNYFDWGGTGLDRMLPRDAGFSGFRVMNGREIERDWIAFQGASYFRASGTDDQYGASARGIAVNAASSTREEFPVFTTYWISEGTASDGPVTVYALLEGPSLTGAYKIEAHRTKGEVMDVHAELYARSDIERLGIAPLTSMYWYSESNRLQGNDWRPEIHDSDGLALWTGAGERIWRPLVNPPSVQTNSFLDNNPRGFGLIQRDRDFDNYQDDGTFYNKRPSIWVEPRGAWGDGAVQLIEIGTTDETRDNIVAYWLPKAKLYGGGSISLDYRLYWQDPEPFLSKSVAHVVSTRIGRGGVAGAPATSNGHKFVIDFDGGPLSDMSPRYDLKPTVTISRGRVERPYSIKVVGTSRWRVVFDVIAEGKQSLDLRCVLQEGGKALTETWLYQYFP